jgi:RND family efflux transporter MFP subunit
MRKGLMSVLLAIGVLAVGCQGPGTGTDEETRVPVEVVEIGLGEVRQTLFYNGDIRAELEVMVFSKVPDRIETYFVEEGDAVQKGDPIAKILATTIEQAVRQAEAGLAAAKAQEANLRSEFARAQRLHNEDAMSRQEYDLIRTNYEAASASLEQAQAGLETAKSQLADATVTSPISGIVGKRQYDPGDMATPAVPVATILKLDNVKIQVEATEEDLGRLETGQNAEVKVRSYPEEIFTGKITKISPMLDPLTRMVTVEILIPNKDYRLISGMYAEVEITTGILENTIVVPRQAVLESTSMRSIDGKDQVVKNYFVYIVNDSSRAEQRQLEVKYVNHQQIAVEAGIEEGERMVISGQNNLRDGLPVLIAEEE